MKHFKLLNFLIVTSIFGISFGNLFYENRNTIDTNTKTNNISENQAFEICLCDKTPYVCDPLCCCDPDCESQVEYWQNTLGWECQESVTDTKDYCYPKEIMRKVNTRRGVQIINGTDSKTDCIRGSSATITKSFIGEETLSEERENIILEKVKNSLNAEFVNNENEGEKLLIITNR